MFAETRLRTGSTWSNFTILRNVNGLTFDTKYLDIGAINFSMLTDDAIANGVTDQSVIEIAPNGTSTFNMWYGIDGTSGTKTTDGARWTTFSGKSIVNWLNDGLVYPSTWPSVPTVNPDGTTAQVIQGHSFQNATPGNILRTLVARCQGRTSSGQATLAWLDVSTFTGTTTSSGAAWATTLTTTYTNGTTMLQVLQDLLARRLIEYRMNGMQLQVFNYGTNPVHYTADQLTFRRGKNVIEQNTNTDSSTSATTVLIQGDNSAIQEISDSGLLTAIGRRKERYVTQGGITDGPTLTLLGTAELSISGHIQVEESLGVTDSGILPWANFQPGDWVWEDVDGTLKNLQIQQIAAGATDASTLTVGLTLGDLIADQDAEFQRRIDNITGQNAGSYGGLPNTLQNFLAPSPPTTVVAAPTAYRDANGIDWCQMTITWAIPITNTDGSPLTDLDRYEVQYKVGSTTTWSNATNVPANSAVLGAFISSLPTGQSFTSQVRAIDTDGNASTWAAQTNTISAMPKITTTPATPATPGLSGGLQSVKVSWNGLDSTGSAYPTSWARTDIHISTTNGFSPTSATRAGSFTSIGGLYTVGGLVTGTTYYVVLIAYDKSGNQSATSTQSAGAAPVTIGAPDIGNKLITSAMIADGTINTNNLNVAAFLDSVAPNGGFEDATSNAPVDTSGAAGWKKVVDPGSANSGTCTVVLDTVAANAAAGNNSLKIHVPAGINGVYAAQSVATPTAFPDIWFVTFKAKGSSAVAQSLGVTVSLGDTASEAATLSHTANGTNLSATLATGATKADLTTGYVQYEFQFTVPTNATPYKFMNVMIGTPLPISGWGSAFDVSVDTVSIRPVGGTASIANASINSAKINDVSATKITAGTLSADVVVGARIKTADSGARVEMNTSGFFAYDALNNETFAAHDADGSVTLSGVLKAPSDAAIAATPDNFPGQTIVSYDGIGQRSDDTTNLMTDPWPYKVNGESYTAQIFLTATSGTWGFNFLDWSVSNLAITATATTIKNALATCPYLGGSAANFTVTTSGTSPAITITVTFTASLATKTLGGLLDLNQGTLAGGTINFLGVSTNRMGLSPVTPAGGSAVAVQSSVNNSFFSTAPPRAGNTCMRATNSGSAGTLLVDCGFMSQTQPANWEAILPNTQYTFSVYMLPNSNSSVNLASFKVATYNFNGTIATTLKTGITGFVTSISPEIFWLGLPQISTSVAAAKYIPVTPASGMLGTGFLVSATDVSGDVQSVRTDIGYTRVYITFTTPATITSGQSLKVTLSGSYDFNGSATLASAIIYNGFQLEKGNLTKYVDPYRMKAVDLDSTTSQFFGIPQYPRNQVSGASFPNFEDSYVPGTLQTDELKAQVAVLQSIALSTLGQGAGSTVHTMLIPGDAVPLAVGTALVPFTNSWVNFGAGFAGASYMKDALGFVVLSGLVKSGTLGNAIFNLPFGYTPAADLRFTTSCASGTATITVDNTGAVFVAAYQAGGTNGNVALDGIRFLPS